VEGSVVFIPALKREAFSSILRKDITSPLSTVGAVVAQPETQVVLKGTNSEMEPANSPDDVGLTLSEGSPRL